MTKDKALKLVWPELWTYTTPPLPVQEPVAVKHMLQWIERLKSLSNHGQHLNITGLGAGACWELANELEQFIKTAAQPAQEPATRVWMECSALAAAIHYPACWDVAAYPELDDALNELAAWFKTTGCETCTPPAAQPALPVQEPTLQEQLDNSQALYAKAHEDWAKAVAALTELNKTETNWFTVNTYLDKANTYVKKTCAYKEMVYFEIQRIKAKLKEKNT
jgi:hypothetical protein